MIGHLHVVRVRQPVEQLLLVVDVAVVVDGLALAEVRHSGWIAETVLLRHQPIRRLDHQDAILGRLVVDQLHVAQNLGAVLVVFEICRKSA